MEISIDIYLAEANNKIPDACFSTNTTSLDHYQHCCQSKISNDMIKIKYSNHKYNTCITNRRNYHKGFYLQDAISNHQDAIL